VQGTISFNCETESVSQAPSASPRRSWHRGRLRAIPVRSCNNVRQAAILFEQAGPCDLADTDHLIQLRGHQGFAAQLAMECDRKSMGFVANALDKVGGRGIRPKHNRVFSTRQEYPLVFFAACLWPIR
jgi:hypothetical protein